MCPMRATKPIRGHHWHSRPTATGSARAQLGLQWDGNHSRWTPRGRCASDPATCACARCPAPDFSMPRNTLTQGRGPWSRVGSRWTSSRLGVGDQCGLGTWAAGSQLCAARTARPAVPELAPDHRPRRQGPADRADGPAHCHQQQRRVELRLEWTSPPAARGLSCSAHRVSQRRVVGDPSRLRGSTGAPAPSRGRRWRFLLQHPQQRRPQPRRLRGHRLVPFSGKP